MDFCLGNRDCCHLERRNGIRPVNYARNATDAPFREGMMSRALITAVLLLTLLTACVGGEPGHQQRDKNINTALTGACLATQLAPCTIAASPEAKASAKEAKAASVRAGAQQEASAASKDAAQRSSCLNEDGPRLPVQASQCSAYATPN
jgi:hypothetical protein